MKKHARRSFLRALGLGAAAGAALPYIPLLSTDAAAADGFPKRLLFVMNGNGTVQERFWPSGGAGALDLSSSPILRELAPFQDRLVVVKGLQHQMFQHGPGRDHVKAKKQCFTQQELLGDGEGNSAWPGETVDHLIARTLEQRARDAGEAPPPVRLLLSAVSRSSGSVLTASGPGAPVPAQNDPRVIFDDLFSGFRAPTESGPDPAAERLAAERTAVFDAVGSRLRHIEDRVGIDGRRKTEAHLEAIGQLQSSLQGLASRASGCAVPELDTASLGGSIQEADFPTMASLHSQLIANAFACDLTRVGTLFFGTATPTWLGDLPIDEGQPATIHNLAHKGTRADKWGPEFFDKHVELEQWRVGKIAELLALLDSVPEGEGTLLDNTLVVWTSDMARGNHNSDEPIPIVLAGGAGGALETGRLVETNGAFSHLLTSVTQLMELDLGSFGDSRYHGAVSGL